MIFIAHLSANVTILATLQGFFDSIAVFFQRFGVLGLFIYSVIETITPLAGVEIILVPLILTSALPWWFITLVLVVANAVGGALVYFLMAKGENKLYNRLVSKKNQEKSEKMFNRYGFWAIFIFAMTPLPFFVILFTASIAKMKFPAYIAAVFASRGVRFYITAYIVFFFRENITTGQIIIWLAIIGLVIGLLSIFVQRKILTYYENKMIASDKDDS